jgi:hypothetical protein
MAGGVFHRYIGDIVCDILSGSEWKLKDGI